MSRTALVVSLIAASAALADYPLNLSEFVNSTGTGTSTCDSNPPMFEVFSCGPYLIGRDTGGSFGTAPVSFIDGGPYTYSIGMAAPVSGVISGRFDLDHFRGQYGREPIAFETRAGICNIGNYTNNSANMSIQLDDKAPLTTFVQSRLAPSHALHVDIHGERFLTLSAQAAGTVNFNPAAWAEPTLLMGPACPTPVIVHQPDDVHVCRGGTVRLEAQASEWWGPFTYQWRHNGQPILLSDNEFAHDPVLYVFGSTSDAQGPYDCVISNGCGSTTSLVAYVHLCRADFNCDAVVDFFDYLDFVSEFVNSTVQGDFNNDGVVDFFDYLDFLQVFGGGC